VLSGDIGKDDITNPYGVVTDTAKVVAATDTTTSQQKGLRQPLRIPTSGAYL
jgi:hypothetical protein